MNRTRNLLHNNKLAEFTFWAISKGYTQLETNGAYEVLRLRSNQSNVPLIFYQRLSDSDRHDSKGSTHITTFGDGTKLVQQWLAERNKRG